MWTLLRRLTSAWVGMWACFYAAAWVTDTRFGGGRSFAIVPLMTGFLFLFAFVVRVRFRWRVIDFGVSYGLALVTCLLLLSLISGYGGWHILDRFSLGWLLSGALLIGVGWWSGCAVGGLVGSRAHHGRKA
jgi:hypothetical protein